MVNRLFTKPERSFLGNLEKSNSDDLFYWEMSNIGLPFVVIIATLICSYLFKQKSDSSWILLINLLFNGSLPIIALNRIGGICFILFKFDKSKEKFLPVDTTKLRTKLVFFVICLLLSIWILYIYQVSFNPFVNWSYWMIFQFIISAFFIYASLEFSKYAHLLQEKSIERSIVDEIREETSKTKSNLRNKYGNKS